MIFFDDSAGLSEPLCPGSVEVGALLIYEDDLGAKPKQDLY